MIASRDRSAKTHFESEAGQRCCALTLGFAMPGRNQESAGNAGALGSFNIIRLVTDQPGRFED